MAMINLRLPAAAKIAEEPIAAAVIKQIIFVAQSANFRHVKCMSQDENDIFSALIFDMLRAVPELVPSFEAYDYNHLPTVCLENVLLPHLIALSANEDDRAKLKTALAWVEHQAGSAQDAVRNLIGNGICEPLVTTKSDHFATLFPHLGPATIALCRVQLHHFKVSREIRQMLGG